jgi:hypothetical protein
MNGNGGGSGNGNGDYEHIPPKSGQNIKVHCVAKTICHEFSHPLGFIFESDGEVLFGPHGIFFPDFPSGHVSAGQQLAKRLPIQNNVDFFMAFCEDSSQKILMYKYHIQTTCPVKPKS